MRVGREREWGMVGTFLPALIANVNLCKSRKSVLLKRGNEAVEFRITNCNLYLFTYLVGT